MTIPMVTGRLWKDIIDSAPVSFIRANVKKMKDAYMVEAELPGVQKEDITLICEKGVLTISANLQPPEENEDNYYVRKERPEGAIVRRFVIEDIDEENISAKLENGVLYVTLPKKCADERRIEIQ